MFIGPGGAAPWDRRDAEVLQAAWEALASLDDLLGPEGTPAAAAPGVTPPGVGDTPSEPRSAAAVPGSAAAVADEEPAGPAVWLGFADGSRLVLDADDPAAAALRAVADRLTTSGVER